jgi:hypothetical protein
MSAYAVSIVVTIVLALHCYLLVSCFSWPTKMQLFEGGRGEKVKGRGGN